MLHSNTWNSLAVCLNWIIGIASQCLEPFDCLRMNSVQWNYCWVAIFVTSSVSAKNNLYWIELSMLDSNNWNQLTVEMKRSFFQAAIVSILLYGCTTSMLTKRLEKKLDSNDTRMLWAIMNRSWRQHNTTQHKAAAVRPPTTHHKNYPS